MGATSIEWCDFTFNPVWGCVKVSPACDNCYAAAFDHRLGGEHWGPHAPLKEFGDKHWAEPLKWNAAAERDGVRRRVFCASMADVFDNRWPDGIRDRLWQLILATPGLDWLLLTKRPQNISKMLPPDWGNGYPNVWLGTTVENQEEADRRIPHLLAVPAAVRFLSCEPLLGPVDLTALNIRAWTGDPVPADADSGWRFSALSGEHWFRGDDGFSYGGDGPVLSAIDWVIAGGESGPGARPMHPDWARSLRDQCAAAGVSFMFKQWGEYLPEDDAYARDLKAIEAGPAPGGMYRVGKKVAGRHLDGVLHDGFPQVRP
jgi:protein gp37